MRKKIIKWTSYTPDGSVIGEFNYQYNEFGQIIQGCSWDNDSGQLKGYSDCSYDEQGNLTSQTWYLVDGGGYSTFYFYDDNGQVMRTEDKTLEGCMLRYTENQYDNRGNKIRYKNYDADGMLMNYGENHYDEHGVYIGQSYYGASGILISNSFYQEKEE